MTKDNVSLNLAKKNGSFGMQFEDQEFAKRIRKKRMTRRIKHLKLLEKSQGCHREVIFVSLKVSIFERVVCVAF